MTRFVGLWALLIGLLAPSLLRAEEPRNVFNRSIDGVVWIENHVSNGTLTGSGFLIDRDRKLIVTNYHVTDGEETMDVYFPVRDREGRLIGDRAYYRNNRAALRGSGHYSPGRVVAYAPEKDLAIVEIRTLPSTAVELSTASGDPSYQDQLHVLGNPAGRDLWRWSAAIKPSVGHFRGNYNNYRVSMDYRRLSFSSSSFGGNSGGPVLNDDGQVVGVLSSGGGEGGISAGAVHWAEVDDLLETITKHRVISIDNTSDATLRYQIRWGDGEWKDWEVQPRSSMVHWLRGDRAAKPQIRFDASADSGYQERSYTLEYYVSDLGRNVTPSLERDAMEYYFRYDSSGWNLDLYKR